MTTPATHSPTERIIDAATRLFSTAGIADTSVEDVAREAGLSRATVYRHVEGGRDEIVLRVIVAAAKDDLQRIAERVRANETGFEDRVVAFITTVLDHLRREHDPLSLFSAPSVATMIGIEGWTEAAVELLTDIARSIFDDARERNEVAADLTDAEIAEWLVRQSATLALMRSARTARARGLESYLRRFVVSPLLESAPVRH